MDVSITVETRAASMFNIHLPCVQMQAGESRGFLSVSEDGSTLSMPSFEEEDAWIDLTPPTVTSSPSPTHKARRTRELFLALTRRLRGQCHWISAPFAECFFRVFAVAA